MAQTVTIPWDADGAPHNLIVVVDPWDAQNPAGQIAEINEENNMAGISVVAMMPPTNLTASPVPFARSIVLSWTRPEARDARVPRTSVFRVYRDTEGTSDLLAELPATVYVDRSVDAASYMVTAVNEYGAESAPVGPVSASLPTMGDFDGDGDVDSEDFVQFLSCFTGPDDGPPSGGCEVFDFDGDGDIDCDDFHAFTEAWTGPGSAPEFAPCEVAPVPTVSRWGLAVLALVLLIVAKIMLRQSRHATP